MTWLTVQLFIVPRTVTDIVVSAKARAGYTYDIWREAKSARADCATLGYCVTKVNSMRRVHGQERENCAKSAWWYAGLRYIIGDRRVHVRWVAACHPGAYQSAALLYWVRFSVNLLVVRKGWRPAGTSRISARESLGSFWSRSMSCFPIATVSIPWNYNINYSEACLKLDFKIKQMFE